MAGSVNFAGLVSGLDTNQIIEDLMKVDSQPLTRLENQKTEMSEQRDTFTSMNTGLLDLKTALEDIRSSSSFGMFTATASDEDALGISASTSASAGTYSLRILSLAQAETLSGNSYTDATSGLGISGEILVNNESLRIETTDSLIDIRNSINNLEAGATASILKVTNTDYRLIISAESQGADGFSIANAGSADTLFQLGLTDGTTGLRSVVNGDVRSGLFSSSSSTITSLTGISSQASGNVKIAGKTVAIDLADDTLASIRDKINNLGVPGVTAEVETVEVDDEARFRLAIRGTSSFTDDAHVLESLGILEGGTGGIAAQFSTSGVLYYRNGSQIASENALLKSLGAVSGETISITGTTGDGAAVDETFQISGNVKVHHLLDAIETAFGGSVNASLSEDGRVMVTAATAGTTDLTVSLQANNELGGTLDFGSMVTDVEGRERLLVDGRDAKIRVNNIEVSRSTNEITDVLAGLSLSLRKADPDTDVTLTVERNTEAIIEKIDAFITAYNDFMGFVKEKSNYDQDTKTAGPLLGDLTTRTTVNRIRTVIQSSVFGTDLAYSRLVQVGIDVTLEGTIKLDKTVLQKAMSEDMQSVISLFAANRTSSDNDISLVYSSTKTKPGSYDVEITRAAEKAQVMSDANIPDRSKNGQMTIVDNLGASLTVSYSKGMTLSDIANEINTEADASIHEILQSSVLKTKADAPVTLSTAISDIADSTADAEDTVTLSVTNRSGKTYQRILTNTADDPVTIDDILSSIESLNNYRVIASIDSNGRINVEDRTAGASKIAVSVTSSAGSLNFGSFAQKQAGRNPVEVTASTSGDGRLVLTQNTHGSEYSFTVAGGASFGIADKEYAGVDVAGAINGVEATGRGQTLTASSSDEYTRGMVLHVGISATELADQGSSQGTVTFISGIADRLFSEVSTMTDSVDGFIKARIDGYDTSIKSLDSRIDDMNKRLDQKRAQYVRKYAALERSLSQLDSLQKRLTSSLSSLPTTSFSTLA